ncbi:MAG: tol-pal system-associated acyl-CoA thioesterase [Pseudomonadota bacterium]
MMNAYAWPVRVYYEDTDAAGVVYYANYLKFMERARTEWLRAAGFEQTTLAQEHGVVFVVRALTIEFLRPALFNDGLEITVEFAGARGSLIELAQTVRRGRETLLTSQVKVACVNTRSFKPVRIPGPVIEKLAARQR